MPQVQQLFDVFDRTDEKPAPYSESHYESLNRLAWRNVGVIRTALEDWFSRYPIDHGASLRSRFCSRKDDAHKGAFFELLLHQFLVGLGCSIEVEPETSTSSTGRPDYLVALDTGATFYLEATVSGVNSMFDYSPIENAVLDELNKLICPDFWLAADFEGTMVSTPPLRRMRSELQRWIDGLDYETATSEDLPDKKLLRYRYTHGAWTLKLNAFPRDQAARGKSGTRPLGSPPGHVGWVDSASPIKKAVTKKANRYGRLDAPLIVAVNYTEPSVDRIDVMEALFGRERWTYAFGQAGAPTDPTFSREHNGAWVNASGARNTRVSGALVFQNAAPSGLASTSICLYKNPWAAKPVPSEMDCLPHAALSGEQMEWVEGRSLGSVLGLPEGWPGPK